MKLIKEAADRLGLTIIHAETMDARKAGKRLKTNSLTEYWSMPRAQVSVLSEESRT